MKFNMKTRIPALFLVLALLSSLAVVPASAAYSTSAPAAAQVVTDRDPLNIRSGAGSSYKVVSQADKNSYLEVIGESGSFYKVIYSTSGKTGFAAKQYLKIVSTKTAKVTTQRDPLVLRSKASSSGTNLAQIPKGTVVPVLGQSGDWKKIVYGNRVGYSYKSYLTDTKSNTEAKKTSISFQDISNPGTITKGTGVHISGTVKSTNSKLTSVTASIRNASGKVIVSKTVNPNATSYKIYDSTLDYAMTFGSLSAGSYTLRYDAKTADGTTNSTSKTFTVKDKQPNTSSSSSFVPAANVAVYQGKGTGYCTAASAATLVRAKLNMQNKNYAQVTLNTVLDAAWCPGLSLDFWIGSAHLKAERLTGNASQKQTKVTNLLKSHPEGIVLYGWKDSGAQHAIYMASNGKILDPYFNDNRYRNLAQSASSASDNWSTINQYWIIVN